MMLIAWWWNQLHLNHMDLKYRRKGSQKKGECCLLNGQTTVSTTVTRNSYAWKPMFLFLFQVFKGEGETRIYNSDHSGNILIVPYMPQFLLSTRPVSKLLGFPSCVFGTAPTSSNTQDFSHYLSQSDKCTSMLNISIPILPEGLGFEVRIATENNVWHKVIVHWRWNFRHWGIVFFPRRGASPWPCQIIHLVLLTYKVGQGYSLPAPEQSPLSGGSSGNRWSHSWADSRWCQDSLGRDLELGVQVANLT